MKVCVLGSGASGSAHAALLALGGHDVTLLKTTRLMNNEHFDAMSASGGVWLTPLQGQERFVPLKLTRNWREATAQPVDAIFISTQSHAHPTLAQKLAETLISARIIIAPACYLGSAPLWRALSERVEVVAEGESPPYDARVTRPGRVRLCFKNVRNALGFLPNSRAALGLELAAQLFETYRYKRAHVVESALRNPNLILHTVGCVLSASRIEYSQGEFWMYREGFTDAVWRVIKRLDDEKCAILTQLGCTRSDYLTDCQFRNESDLSRAPIETFRAYAAQGGPKGPQSLQTRFLTEDVPNGLGLLTSLGQALNVPTPTADALTVLAGALLGEDFQKKRRTLRVLGVNSREELDDLQNS